MERYRADPRNFKRRTLANLLAGVIVLALAAAITYFAVKVVGLQSGGDALLLMVATMVLVAVTILHDVIWRLDLSKREGRPSASTH
jgi:high-affinity Fe2+/Pb2+ permease